MPPSLIGTEADVEIGFNTDDSAVNKIKYVKIHRLHIDDVNAYGLQFHTKIKVGEERKSIDVDLPITQLGNIHDITVSGFQFA